jgi:hypothetical protein
VVQDIVPAAVSLATLEITGSLKSTFELACRTAFHALTSESNRQLSSGS